MNFLGSPECQLGVVGKIVELLIIVGPIAGPPEAGKFKADLLVLFVRSLSKVTDDSLVILRRASQLKAVLCRPPACEAKGSIIRAADGRTEAGFSICPCACIGIKRLGKVEVGRPVHTGCFKADVGCGLICVEDDVYVELAVNVLLDTHKPAFVEFAKFLQGFFGQCAGGNVHEREKLLFSGVGIAG